ncbi:anti-sigma-D factor RsdA [Gordonia sp. 'Campus']|uniref:anti-sigma-D factor RsdA n=1 Tax=Gordonia sp. 'Campus' TaxID=2915824 RepID=UPI001EE418FD|nr:anti-sigma-D factor RsdA [Gordonia sp. 'Campus']
MSGQSDWRRRRVTGGDQPNRPGQPPAHRRAPGPSGPAPAGPGPRPVEPISPDVSHRDLDHDVDPVADGAPNLSEVGFDENFLDALTRDVPVPTRDAAEYELAELLSGWKSEVVSKPAERLISVDDVERAIGTTERASRGRRMVRHLRVVSGAAAIVIVAAAGLTVLSEGSQPGDPLWGIKQVVFAEAASQTQAAHDVRNNLERAEAAIAAGDPGTAASLLAEASERMGPMRDNEMRDEMTEWLNRLRAGAGLPDVTSLPLPSGSEQPTTIEPTRPDLRESGDKPSPADGSTPPPGEESDNPTTLPEVPSEEPVPSSDSPSTGPAQPSAPTSSTKVTRFPAEFPEIPWTPPPGVDASGRPIG